MSAEAVAFSRSWRVGRYRVELSVPRPKHGSAVHAVMEWIPRMPPKLTPDEIDEYRAGRDSALKEMAAELGVRIMVADL